MLNKVWNILQKAKSDHNFIGELKYAPDNEAIIVDISYGKALRISTRGNEIHVQGDLTAGEQIKKIIERAISKCQ